MKTDPQKTSTQRSGIGGKNGRDSRRRLLLFLAGFVPEHRGLVARSAVATADSSPVRVPFVVRMALSAVGLPRVDCSEGLPAQHVFFVRYGLEVVRINAPTHPTQVVELETFRNRTDDDFVDPTVGLLRFPVAVTTGIDFSQPEPAARVGVDVV